jgi:hypothetical protein
MADESVQPRAATPSVLGDQGGLISCLYDATGLATVTVAAWPIIGWAFDMANPINPAPVVMGNPLTTPPSTGAILSPPWAYVLDENACYVPTTGVVGTGWRGTFAQLLTWLATNNNAHRKIIGQFAVPPLSNAYAQWARDNKALVGP